MAKIESEDSLLKHAYRITELEKRVRSLEEGKLEKIDLNYSDIMENRRMIAELLQRIQTLEAAFTSLQHGVGDGSKHKNDGGWFD